MLNAGNLLFVAFARYWGNVTGLVWVFFVLVVAAAEAAVAWPLLSIYFALSKWLMWISTIV